MKEARSNDEVLRDANEAISLLESTVFKLAVKHTEEAIIDRWKRADTVVLREKEYAQLQGLTLVITELMTLANDGKHVQHTIEKAEKAKRGPGTSQRQGA